MNEATNINTTIATDEVETPPRAWQRMLSGRRLDLLNPSPQDIEIEDIAHGLARVARWNGQTKGAHALSVAQHVLIVEQILNDLTEDLSPKWSRAALLHDAPEYVIGDLISPFKVAIGLDYKNFEKKLLAAIHERFALPRELPAEVSTQIKTADQIAAHFEATKLAGFTQNESKKYFGVPKNLSEPMIRELERISPWPTAMAQTQFLNRFHSVYQSVIEQPKSAKK